jgi:uncharacterized protein (TIGR04222 family)
MLLNNHTALWNKIREFPLNEPGAAITFSHKLQEQQEWSASYTERVIEEYRKFIFLCTVAPKGASPSKVVDEAWHMHLTYTKSYWIDLCRNTLGRDLHHHPSKGGNEEDHKHEEWYKETLEFYRQAFGSEPPSDIWPPPLDANAPIPEPNFPLTQTEKWQCGAILLIPFVYSFQFYGELFPFRLTGPEFLWFYPLLAFALLGIYLLMHLKRRRFYRNLVNDIMHEDINFYQKTEFIYGHHRAVQAAIVDLVQRGFLEVLSYKRFRIRNEHYERLQNETNLLMDWLAGEKHGALISYDEIASNWYEEARFTHPMLRNLQEFAYRENPFWPANWMWFVILVFGFIRLMQGTYRGMPVSYLVVEMALLIILSLIVRALFVRRILIFKWVEEVFEQQTFNDQVHPDAVVNHFAVRGHYALSNISSGAVLGSFFAGYALTNHSSIFGSRYGRGTVTGGCGSGGGCGSSGGDGGGGGSCGGGGGCGGCGGGGD